MARLEKDEINKREEFIRSLFLAEPRLSMPKANDRLYEKFKSRMRPNRIYEIRDEVQQQLAKFHKATQVKPEEGVAARNGPWTQTVTKEPEKASLVSVGTGNEEIAKRVIDTLKNSGLFSGRVEHTFSGYLVVVNG